MSAHYDGHATRVVVVIVSNNNITTSTTAGVTFLDYGATPSEYKHIARQLDDEVFHFPSDFVMPRPRKGAYVALLPRLPFVPSLEASPRSAPRVVRQAGWRLAVHTRHVTTSL